MDSLFERLRPLIFWTLDGVRGGPVRRAIREVRNILEDPGSPGALALRAANLESLLRHARATVPHYRNLPEGTGLEGFPVVDKNLIRKDPDAFLSEAFRGRKLHSVTTSGSTGTPFRILQDPGKRARHQADSIHCCARAGYPIGTRLYYLRVWNRINRKSPLAAFMENTVPVDISDQSGDRLGELTATLRRDRSAKAILGYASSLEVLAQHLAKAPVEGAGARVRTVMAMSETLPDPSREILRAAFGCPVISRYSNMENGFIAQQCVEDNREYHLNVASYHVEVLALDRDEPAAPGELGRIVVTDLFNRAMPLIRYDTGDTGEYRDEAACGAPGPVLRRVEGRRVDFIYDVRGHLLSPHVITNTLWKYDDIAQFQFVQEGPGRYVIKVNCGGTAYPREGELLAELRGYLGKDADLSLETVAEIPLLRSGKRKKIVNAWKN